MPLWSQVCDDLRRRLNANEFSGHFPGDGELMDGYKVSRHTVREAVRRLSDDGLVVRERGRGTRVISPGIEQPLGTLYSLYRSIEAQGYEQHSVVRVLDERTDAEATGVLGLADDEPMVYLERLRRAGDRALALDCSWLPASLARPLLNCDFSRTALYGELAERTGEATREIAQMIHGIQSGNQGVVHTMEDGVSQVTTGVALAHQAGEAVVSIRNSAEQVVTVVSTITTALQEQVQASADVAANVEKIAAMAESKSQSVRQAHSTALSLQHLAAALERAAGLTVLEAPVKAILGEATVHWAE